MPTNQVTEETPEVWYKKWGKLILIGLLTILTLGVFAAARSRSNSVPKELDDIDREVIDGKIVEANEIGQEIEREQDTAQQISTDGQARMDELAANNEANSDSGKISDFNAAMRDRRNNR